MPSASPLRQTFVECPETGSIADAVVLVIDDEPGTLGFVRDVLDEAGYFVVPATDGESGLRLMGLVRFDLVVTDVMMPGLDGLEVLRRVRRADPAMQVLLFSGHPSRELAREAWRSGAAGFVSKPFVPDQFLRAIAKAIDRTRRARWEPTPQSS